MVGQARCVSWCNNIDFFWPPRLGLLQCRNFVINLMTKKSIRRQRLWDWLAEHTRAMAKYSTTTDATFIAKLTMMANSVEIPSMRAMKRGAISLHVRSIRLICALMSYASQFGRHSIRTSVCSTSQRLFIPLRNDNDLFKT